MTTGFTEKKKARTVLFYVILGLASFGFLAVFSYYTSPFSVGDNGYDAAFFRLVGQGMTQGYLPYRDFFDMKGPFLFFIEYASQVIAYGRAGIFLIQTLNLWLCLILICRIFELYGISSRALQVWLLLPLAYVASFTFEGGNLTEELSLVPLFSCLFLCLAFLKNSEKQTPFWQRRVYWYAGAWFGICFGLLLMIRVTNAALIGAMGLTIALHLIVKRRYPEIAVCAGMFLAGLSLSVLPAILFFGAKGLLGDMYEAVFVLGFKYSGEKSFTQHVTEVFSSYMRWQTLLVVIPALLPTLLRWAGWKERFLALTGGLFTFFAVVAGNNHPHYYTLTIPLIVLGEMAVVEAVRSGRRRSAILAAALSSVMLISQFPLLKDYLSVSYSHLFRGGRFDQAQTVRDVSSKIPDADKTSVFCYNINPSWYTYTDIFPCIKYCGWQNHYISLMPEIYDRLKERFQTEPPVWLVLPKPQGDLPDFLEVMVRDVYRNDYENEKYILYTLRSEK